MANIRCAEIMEDQLRALAEDQAWLGLRQEAATDLVPNFGTRAAALLDSCLSGAPRLHCPILCCLPWNVWNRALSDVSFGILGMPHALHVILITDAA